MIVYVMGFPHCGTTILRKVCAKITGLEEKKLEVYTRKNLDQIVSVEDGPAVYKSPYPVEINNADKTLFILRQPDFVFYSLEKRFQQQPVGLEHHTLEDYEKALDKFENFDGFTIKYENLFTDRLKLLFEYLEKPYKPDTLEVEAQHGPSPPYHEPFHGARRMWQIEQPFRNMNLFNDHQEDPGKMNYLIQRYNEMKSTL